MEFNVFVIVFGLFFSFILLWVFKISPYISGLKSDRKTLKEYRKNNISKSGGTSLYYPPNWDVSTDGKFFNYHLMSFDGGKNWYAVDKKKLFDEIVILGSVDDVYPGLVKYLSGMSELTKHVTKNGPIDVTKQKDLDVLKNSGFDVIKKSK
jgi:hypothetical protein